MVIWQCMRPRPDLRGAASHVGLARWLLLALRHRLARARPNEKMVACPLCEPTQLWKAKLMPQHMGAHLIEDSWAKYRKEKPRMPCMLCGVNSAVGERMTDASNAVGCPVWLTPGSKKTVMKPQHQCAKRSSNRGRRL